MNGAIRKQAHVVVGGLAHPQHDLGGDDGGSDVVHHIGAGGLVFGIRQSGSVAEAGLNHDVEAESGQFLDALWHQRRAQFTGPGFFGHRDAHGKVNPMKLMRCGFGDGSGDQRDSGVA